MRLQSLADLTLRSDMPECSSMARKRQALAVFRAMIASIELCNFLCSRTASAAIPVVW
jgi:hypothetical protein